ncbi:C40 family peptidase [Pontibacter sp. CAU 1760]
MKKTFAMLAFPLLTLAILSWTNPTHFTISQSAEKISATLPHEVTSPEIIDTHNKKIQPQRSKLDPESTKVVTYALSLMGAPYVYAGITPDGFDCSGFITHVFDSVGVDLPHSSAMQASEGQQITPAAAVSGDLIIFTGTDATIREPGHVGLIISGLGEPIEFVHASSNGGVKISQLDGTGYENRFLEIRRVL